MSTKTFQKKNIVKKEAKEFDEEVIQIDRVTRVVKGGRRLRFRATVAIGDRKGRVAIGLGKSNEVAGAIQKAVAKAKKSLIKVPLIQGTIPHYVKVKFKSARVLIMPASPGTGVIAGGAIRKVLDLAGVKNVLSKSFGSSNRVNASKVAIKALSVLRHNPHLKYKQEFKEEEIKKVDEKTERKPMGKKPMKKTGEQKVPMKKEFEKKMIEPKPGKEKESVAKKSDSKPTVPKKEVQ